MQLKGPLKGLEIHLLSPVARRVGFTRAASAARCIIGDSRCETPIDGRKIIEPCSSLCILPSHAGLKRSLKATEQLRSCCPKICTYSVFNLQQGNMFCKTLTPKSFSNFPSLLHLVKVSLIWRTNLSIFEYFTLEQFVNYKEKEIIICNFNLNGCNLLRIDNTP